MRVLFCVLLWGSLSVDAFASLGGNSSSIDSDSQRFNANHRQLEGGSSYSLHELSTSTMTIREYVSANGNVFAVTWRGNKAPNLSVILGSYYQEFTQANSAVSNGSGRRPTSVKSANTVVQRAGHMRDIRGKAYVPSLVPAGLNVESLQ